MNTETTKPNILYWCDLPKETQRQTRYEVECHPDYYDLKKAGRERLHHAARVAAAAYATGLTIDEYDKAIALEKEATKKAEAERYEGLAAKAAERKKQRFNAICEEWSHFGVGVSEKIADIILVYGNEIELIDFAIGDHQNQLIEVRVQYDLFHGETTRLGISADEIAQKEKEMWAHDFGIWISGDNPDTEELLKAEESFKAIHCLIKGIDRDEINDEDDMAICHALSENSRIIATYWTRDDDGSLNVSTAHQATFTINLGMLS